MSPPPNSLCFMFNCPNCPNLNKPGEWRWRSLLVLKFTKRFKHSLLNLSLILYTVNYDLGDWKTLLLSLELLLQIMGLFIFVLLLYIRWRLLVNMIKSSSEKICWVHLWINAGFQQAVGEVVRSLESVIPIREIPAFHCLCPLIRFQPASHPPTHPGLPHF